MVTVILKIRLDLPGVDSLKGKRRIIKSLMAVIKNKFNVSIAEVGDNDVLRSTLLGAAVVSNENSFGHQVMAKLVDTISQNPEVVILDYSTENY